jgi:hypothetical protein
MPGIVMSVCLPALLQTIVFYLGFVSSVGAAVGCAIGGVAIPADAPAFLALFGTGAQQQCTVFDSAV